MVSITRQLLFGGDLKWKAADWTASDDRVRGGKSESHLTPLPPPSSAAQFHGHLDIQTLGGAGFASQHTTTPPNTPPWDLSPYSGISLTITHGDDKLYTFLLKDQLGDRYRDNAGSGTETGTDSERSRASLNWEAEFRVPDQCKATRSQRDSGTAAGEKPAAAVFLPWGAFKPTYRGQEIKDPEQLAGCRLDLHNVQRISLMIRSFFGSQEGDFSLTIRAIEAVMADGEGEREGRKEA